ncbi:hypothetical protein ACO0LF_16010 [Undibacterium sp. Di27W]|uniref:hypothetical protein n=1 Tax=Undibacterium sp. Di27W TaxID=3413036 RepID=UPI003BF025DC
MLLTIKKLLFCALSLGFSLALANEAKPLVRKEVDLDQELLMISVPKVCETLKSEQFSSVELRINGVLSQRKLLDCNPDPSMNKLVFQMPQTDSSIFLSEREAVMGTPWQESRHGYGRDLPFNVSVKKAGISVVLATGSMHFQILKPAHLIFGFGFIAVVGYALFRLGRDSGLLRDSNSVAVEQRTYSLARVQMAWWFFIVLASYIWLCIATEGIPTISAQALGLLGIGSATYLTAAGVDTSKPDQLGESQGFFHDILSDSQGLTLHRFQMLVFNVLIGFLFLIYVVQHFNMPNLDSNILALLGMSAGTYAGFKIPEKQGEPAVEDSKAAYTVEDK